MLVLLALASGAASASVPLESCELAHPGFPLRIKAQCGRIAVPEDPSQPNGKQIALRIAVLRATANQPAADPIFFLAGGPGQAATEAYALISDLFERAGRTRDVVLVDQRGTGGSNRLACDFGDDELAAPSDAEIRAATERCLSSLPGDPRFYTTTLAVEDLDRVRAALRYQKVDLFGVSYGTRVALTYLRRFPDRVRSVVLQGVVPSELALGSAHAKHLDRALDLIFERCSQDAACGARFPDLRKKLEALIARVDADPPKVEIPDPLSGEPLALTVDRSFFAVGIRFLAYVPESAAVIPLLLHEAHETGRFDRLAAQSAIVARQVRGVIASGLELSVVCTEDVPLYDPNASGGRTLLGDRLMRSAIAQCAVWPKGKMPEDFHDPVKSNVPVLLISGELDPVTPPEDAEKVRRHLPRSRHLVLSNHGHLIARGCMPRLIDEFFETADPNLDARCLERLRPPPFFIRLTGPEP